MAQIKMETSNRRRQKEHLSRAYNIFSTCKLINLLLKIVDLRLSSCSKSL